MVEIATSANGKRSDVILNDALHVPKLRTNLLSVSKITDKGYKVVFDDHEAAIVDKQGHTKLIAKRINNLYYVKGTSPESCHNTEHESEREDTAKSRDLSSIWHRRMGHLNFQDLHSAWKNGVIRGIEMSDKSQKMNCEVCIQGKMTRLSFPKESNRKTSTLELIHTDVCGPMRTSSNGGSFYFIIFIDDSTRWK